MKLGTLLQNLMVKLKKENKVNFDATSHVEISISNHLKCLSLYH